MSLGPFSLRIFQTAAPQVAAISMGWKPLGSDYWMAYEAETYNFLCRMRLAGRLMLDISMDKKITQP